MNVCELAAKLLQFGNSTLCYICLLNFYYCTLLTVLLQNTIYLLQTPGLHILWLINIQMLVQIDIRRVQTPLSSMPYVIRPRTELYEGIGI